MVCQDKYIGKKTIQLHIFTINSYLAMETEICGVLHHESGNNNKSFSYLLSDVFVIIFSYYLVCFSSVNSKVILKTGNL